MIPQRALDVQHLWWDPVLQYAKVIVDATCGNGHDTLYLARHSLPQAKVYGLDIQEEALANTRERTATYEDKITLRHISHDIGIQEMQEPIDLLVFNLGYLPGSDHTCMTVGSTTIQALTKGLERLAPQGYISIVAYPGTEQGKTEMQDILQWMKVLPQQQYITFRWEPLNQINNPPVLLGIMKRK